MRPRHRADPADLRLAHQNGRTGAQRRRGLHRHHALPHAAAVLHARHHLLADEAALLERHAVEQIEVRLMREGLADGKVLPGLRHAQGDAVRVIGVGGQPFGIGRRVAESGVEPWRDRREHPQAHLGHPRVRVDNPFVVGGQFVVGGRRPGPGGRHLKRTRHILRRDLGTQHVHPQSLDEAIGQLPARLQQEGALVPRHARHEELEQHLALRRQQGRVHRGLPCEQIEVGSDGAVQEFLRVGAGHAHDAAVGEERHLCERHIVPCIGVRPLAHDRAAERQCRLRGVCPRLLTGGKLRYAPAANK